MARWVRIGPLNFRIFDKGELMNEREDGFERRQKEKEAKAPLSMIPTYPLMEVAHVLQYGAVKYERDLWRKQPQPVTGRIDSALRHIRSYNEGVDLDPDSGDVPPQNQLAQAIVQLMFAMETAKTHPELDDRYDPDCVELPTGPPVSPDQGPLQLLWDGPSCTWCEGSYDHTLRAHYSALFRVNGGVTHV